ncbi:MAG TPA: hypothetical protein VKA08_16145 [Balneolales bacterium]|nr:hypothetical protein [Balneolales bacterium]
MNKAAVIMLTGLLAIPLTAGLSAAENKLIVQDPSANDVFVVDDSGNTGFNLSIPNYAADVANNGGAAKAELHFSKDGADNGGYLTSVSENNFWISSGGVYDQAAGGWIQKSSDGQSVFFGSGGVGFRAFLQEGNTQGQPMSNVNVAMLMDYNGNMKVRGGLQMNMGTGVAQPGCDASSQGMMWMTKAATDIVEICASKGGSLAWYPVSF